LKGISQAQLERLEQAVRVDAGAAGFPALAEVYRRAGRFDEAERVARDGLEHKPDETEGRMVLAFVLLDQGRVEESRAMFERLTQGVLASQGIDASPESAASFDDGDADGALSDAELEDAFLQAETDTDELIDPNKVAAEAVAHLDASAEEGIDEVSASNALEPGSAFATATMAELLEQQGDESGALRIRAALESRIGPAADGDRGAPSGGGEVIETLERWLANLRGDRR